MLSHLVLSLTLLLPGCNTTTQGDPQTFPPDVMAEIEVEVDKLTAEGVPPGISYGLGVMLHEEMMGHDGRITVLGRRSMICWNSIPLS